jgi:hypothetical protein
MNKPPSELSPQERLALLNELEQREAGAMRKAARGAWVSLAIVASLLALLVFGVIAASVRLRDVRTSLASLERETQTKQERLESLNQEINQKQTALAALIGAVRTNPQTLSGVGTALDNDPRAATLVPRAYVQILDDMDRQWAKNLSERLQNGGVIPVGIDYVPNAEPLERFEVRYYKKSEEDGAKRIVGIMRDAGVTAEPVYLNLEVNRRVRDNRFEIWCPANARASKLRPLATQS